MCLPNIEKVILFLILNKIIVDVYYVGHECFLSYSSMDSKCSLYQLKYLNSRGGLQWLFNMKEEKNN